MTPTADSTLLAQIQASITQALAGLDARERAVEPSASASAASAADSFRPAMAKCRQRLSGLQVHAQAVAVKLNDVDGGLATEEKTLRDFLAEAAAMRQKLAAWAGRAIG